MRLINKTPNKPRVNFQYYLTIIFFYFFSRVFLYLGGVKFDIEPINYYWQFIDINLLKDNFFSSIFYFHQIAPFLNIITGILLKLTNDIKIISNTLFYIISIIISINIFNTLNFFFQKKISLICSIIFLLHPGIIGFENHFYRTHFETLFISFIIYFLISFIYKKKNKYFLYFSIAYLFCFLTRETFDIILYLLISIILIIITKKKKIIYLTLLFFIILNIFLLKNFYLFNFYGTSSAGWDNASSKYYILFENEHYNSKNNSILEKFLIRSQEKKKLQKEIGCIINYAWQENVAKYKDCIKTSYNFKHEVLSAEIKSNGNNNYNNQIYLDIQKIRKKTFFLILEMQPQIIAWGIFDGFVYFFKSVDQFGFIKNNINNIKYLNNIFNIFWYGNFIELFENQLNNKIILYFKYFNFFLFSILIYSTILVIKKIKFISNKIILINFFLLLIFYYNMLLICVGTTQEAMRNKFSLELILYLLFLINIYKNKFASYLSLTFFVKKLKFLKNLNHYKMVIK